MEFERVCGRCGKRCVPAQCYCPKCGSLLPEQTPVPPGSARETVSKIDWTGDFLPSSYDEYLRYGYPPGSTEVAQLEPVVDEERQARLAAFPFAVMFEVSFFAMDFANHWCWHRFGPADGECLQWGSEYRACDQPGPHSHAGRWATYWYEKTGYNFGYHEWYFASEADRDRFLQFVSHLNPE